MSKQTVYIFILVFIFTLGLIPSSFANSSTVARVNMEMGANYAKSNLLDLKKETELHVMVKNESESGSWLRFTVDLQKPFEIPGMYLPETIKADWIAIGDTSSFTLKVGPGKYVISLHSDEGNCKGSGTIS